MLILKACILEMLKLPGFKTPMLQNIWFRSSLFFYFYFYFFWKALCNVAATTYASASRHICLPPTPSGQNGHKKLPRSSRFIQPHTTHPLCTKPKLVKSIRDCANNWWNSECSKGKPAKSSKHVWHSSQRENGVQPATELAK